MDVKTMTKLILVLNRKTFFCEIQFDLYWQKTFREICNFRDPIRKSKFLEIFFHENMFS